ncbi:hypothetical protein JZ751_011939 [Albula glossodonta]|uniref:Uncharacterized protein n=1 Tax=Albula glossodonta TaxID=121402 RepID=A0A8T2PR30_9TELE|nr:hypothetical protein JZ751_011939 [Albula glossodonta]
MDNFPDFWEESWDDQANVANSLTCSEVLCRRMNLPSTSSSWMQTLPVAEAEWAMLTLLLASDSSTSMRLRFPRVVRTLRLDEARDTVTREEGLGDSFSLKRGEDRGGQAGTVWRVCCCILARISLISRSFSASMRRLESRS